MISLFFHDTHNNPEKNQYNFIKCRGKVLKGYLFERINRIQKIICVTQSIDVIIHLSEEFENISFVCRFSWIKQNNSDLIYFIHLRDSMRLIMHM